MINVGTIPDKILSAICSLFWPLDRVGFAIARRVLQRLGRLTGAAALIKFGNVAITVPLEHPAVYWRFRPVGFNLNFVTVVQATLRHRDGLVIDVGANVGDGVALLRGAGITANVLAIEGGDEYFRALRANEAALSPLMLEQVFLGAEDKVETWTLDAQEGTGKLVHGGTGGVPIHTLDRVLERKGGPKVALLKTDTDGFDVKVILGARSLLTDEKPVVFAEVDQHLVAKQGNNPRELLAFLNECGYAYMAVWDSEGEWLGGRPLSQGLDDLIGRYPGGPRTPYLDVAFITEEDLKIWEWVHSECDARGYIPGARASSSTVLRCTSCSTITTRRRVSFAHRSCRM